MAAWTIVCRLNGIRKTGFIVCDNKPDSLIAPCPIDHMALLGIHTSDQLNRKFTLFYPAYELVIFFQFPKRGK